MDKQPQLDPELSMTLKYILENPELLNAPEKVQESGNDEKSKEKKLEDDMTDLSSAYLGPQLWDNMLLCDDLKMEPVEMNDILSQSAQNTDSDVSDLAMLIQSANYSPGNTTEPQDYPELEMYTNNLNGSPANSQKEKDAKEKQLEDEMPDLQSAFLGPQLWNNMLMSDDLKLEPVEMSDMLDDSICASNDLAMLMRSAQYSPSSSHSDEMRNVSPQNEVPVAVTQPYHHPPMNGQVSLKTSHTSQLLYNGNYPDNTQPQTGYSTLPTSQSSPQLATTGSPESNLQNVDDNGLELPVRIPSPSKCDFQPSEADLLIATPKPEGGDLPTSQIYNPKTRKFMDDELKPQPIIRKAKKLYVNDENKDTKYWARREKNNAAAKRSREARRVKENQIALRASFLEKENQAMKQEITSLRAELAKLVKVVKKYEDGF